MKTKHWFYCNEAIMPLISFYTKPGRNPLCEVDTKLGSLGHDSKYNNGLCINKVRNFLDNVGTRKLIWLVHGYFGNEKKMKHKEFGELKDTILEKYPKSIVGLVIWEKAASFLTGTKLSSIKSRGIGFLQDADSYKNSAVSTWPIGNILAYVNIDICTKFVDFDFKFDSKLCGNVYCIGHSLGAHLCGFYSKMMKRLTQNKFILQKILGLDPAGPIFETIDNKFKLQPSDANSVEVWHTNTHRLGIQGRIGTVDIYINGGYNQPHCGKIEVGVGTIRMPFYSEEKSHKFAKYILKHVIQLNMNMHETGCIAKWLCKKPKGASEEWKPWSLLKNIKKEHEQKLMYAGCLPWKQNYNYPHLLPPVTRVPVHPYNPYGKYRLGQLVRELPPQPNNFPVYWIEIAPDSSTCAIDLDLDPVVIQSCRDSYHSWLLEI